jgi:LPS-assembly lipoprotein
MRSQVICSFIAVFMILGLGACGFEPIYASGSQVGKDLQNIKLVAPPSREAYIFARSFEERLGRNSGASTTLRYNISIYDQGLDLRDVSIAQKIGSVSYQLIDEADGDVIASGKVEAFTSYSSEGNLSVASQYDASERLLIILADRVISKLTGQLPAS